MKETVYHICDHPSRLFNDIIKQYIAEGFNVLVHCEASISRSASVIIGYLIMEKGITPDYTLKYVESNRKYVWPNGNNWSNFKENCEINITIASNIDIYC